MKKRITILCQVISLVYVAICLIALLKTHNRSPHDYARYRINHKETVQSALDRVRTTEFRMQGFFGR